jgi:hypothetical protein
MNGSRNRPHVNTTGAWAEPFTSSSRPSTSNDYLHPCWQPPYTPPHSPDPLSSPGSSHRIHVVQDENDRLKGQNRDLIKENDILKERLDNTKEDLRQANQRTNQHQEENNQVKGQHRDLERENVSLNQRLKDAKAELRQANQHISLLQEELRGQDHDLVRENGSLNQRLRNAMTDLRQANQTINLLQEERDQQRDEAMRTQQEQDAQIHDDRSTIKRLYERNAQLCLRSKEYNEAIEHFQLLIRLMDKEISLKAQQQDRDGQSQAEDARWNYRFQYAEALVIAGQPDLAEHEFDSLLTESKDRFGQNSQRTRDVQTRLCKVLISLGKTRDAKWMYHCAAMQLDNIDQQDESDRTWTLRNAKSYAHILLEEEEYRKAVSWHQDIWLHRHKAAMSDVSELENAVIAFVLSLIKKKRLADASDLLTALQQDNSSDDYVQSPSEDRVSALLAYVYLARGKPNAAETSAAAVYNRWGIASLFQSSDFHHADTLILARTKQDKREKYLQARIVWNEIYNQRNEILVANKDQLKKHVAAGLTLAEEWEKSCERRSTSHRVRARSAAEVREQAEEMRKMCTVNK